MNGKNEKGFLMTELLIINFLLWFPIIIFILFFVCVSRVEAYSYYNSFKLNGSGVCSNTTTSLSCNGGADNLYFRYRANSDLVSGKTAYFNVGYNIAIRYPYVSFNPKAPFVVWAWTSSGNLLDIGSSCSHSVDATYTPSSPRLGQSTLLQLSYSVTCIYTPNTTLVGFAIEYNLPYSTTVLNAVEGTAYSMWDLDITNNKSDAQEIINAYNYNTNKLIDSNTKNWNNFESGDWWSGSVTGLESDCLYCNNASNSEDEIISDLPTINWETFGFNYDTYSFELIWRWVEDLLFTNTIVSLGVMALLSFGIIKLLLNRQVVL